MQKVTTMPKKFRCAFDIGGTFTDFVLLNTVTGEVSLHKRLSMADDPAGNALDGIRDLLQRAGSDFSEIAEIVHGSTIVTNLVIERKGARTALLTTRGFRDILETGTEQRYDIHDIFLRFPEAMVPRSRRIEISERIGADGHVVRPIDLDEVEAATARAVEDGVESIAIVFLHAYRNPQHEKLAAERIRAAFPGLYVTTSSEVGAEIREYERTTTTVANAYAQPAVAPYLEKLVDRLQEAGFSGQFLMMQSSGYLASVDMAKRLPVRLLESGPAGGALAAAHFGAQIGHGDLIAFDMGGTTAKACLIQNGRPDIAPMLEAAREHRFTKGSGIPIRSPVVDLIEIGAGGGSIAGFDELGLLKVGPQSAGATPGPACYGRGGGDPTVSDANLLLGYLGADSFLGGSMKLDVAAAERAFQTISSATPRSSAEAAWDVYNVVCENMAGAARVHVVEKGRDPRDFALMAFGGAGPAHAVRVAKAIGIERVIIPPACGAASALGFLSGAVAHEAVRSMPIALSKADWPFVNRALRELEAEGIELLQTAGLTSEQVTIIREAEIRILGQIHNIRIMLPEGDLDVAQVPRLADAFAATYSRLYGRAPISLNLEILSLRVTVKGPERPLGRTHLAKAASDEAGQTARPVWFPEFREYRQTPVFKRGALQTGQRIVGPAIIEEAEATTVIAPGDVVEVDTFGNMVVSVALEKDKSMRRPAAQDPDAVAAWLREDAASLEILWSRLVTISEECWQTVIRMAFSLIIGESQDFACEILDENGNSLAHSPRAMPVFNISLMTTVKSLLEVYPKETLKPGDVLITNDPWNCAGHLFDIAIVTPVFHGGRIVAFLGSIGHVTDIGGTKDRPRAREIYDEGLQIPPMKLYAAGVRNDDLVRIVTQNVRHAQQVVGDIEALVTANALGAARLSEFMSEYGFTTLAPLVDVIQQKAEDAVRAEIRAVPNGTYSSEVKFSVSDRDLTIPIKIDVHEDSIEVDFEGCPEQLEYGGANCTMTVTRAETLFALKCIFSPKIRASAGCYKPFTVRAPEGSLLNCTRPAAVALRRLTMWQFVGAIFRTLCEAIPHKVQAYTALPTLIDLYGKRDDGELMNDHLFLGGGQGASARQDGKSGMIWPTSAAATSIEMVEARLPVLVEEKILVRDSGGAGQYRGGLGQRIKLRRTAGEQPFYVNVYPEGSYVSSAGLLGGGSGGKMRAFLHTADGKSEEYLSGKAIRLTSEAELVEILVGGGAGYGQPADRDPQLAARDIHEGYTSSRQAPGKDCTVQQPKGRAVA